jgi:hypothetical protein
MMRSVLSSAWRLAAFLSCAVAAAPAGAQSTGTQRAAPPAAKSQYKVTCGHDCLAEFAERFLTALTTHNASAVALAPNVRYTENGAQLAIGDALWSTAQKLGDNKLVFTDPESGGIQLYAAVVESGLPSMLAARLKVEHRLVTEIEATVLRRNADDAAMASFAVDRPIWHQQIAAGKRVSRQGLVDIADSYFEGITQARGDVTPFDPQCTRFEDGGQMTLNPNPSANPVTKMGCQEQFAAGMLVIVTSVSHRRYLVVDEDDQIVCAIATFDHRGSLEAVPYARGRDYKPNGAFTRPFSFLIFEAFKVVDGKIRQIEATVFSVPYKMNPGWPDE